ncbi:MAG: DNA polymerase III subunit [Desulfamplus sp.]|nr:DNA polymerase III subunit [Desulfamplus sp.]
MYPVDELKTILLNRRIPNALLFTGSCEQEKKKVAMTFVKNINCLGRDLTSNDQSIGSQSDSIACNKCGACNKIDAAMHPDIITVAPEPEKKIIKIAQIRELCGALVSKPHEARMRMVIIEDAHAMNRESANALLKILEEPPERTFFVLLSASLNDLLPTIISRCRHIRFRPLSLAQMVQRLVAECNVPSSTARIAASSSNGDMEVAMMFANIKHKSFSQKSYGGKPVCKSCLQSDEIITQGVIEQECVETEPTYTTDWISLRRWLLDQLFLLVKDKNSSSAYLYALVLAEKLSRETARMPYYISLIKLWLRDIALVRYLSKNGNLVCSDKFVNSDFVHELSNIAPGLPENYPVRGLEAIHAAEIKLKTNASVRLVLEQFFLSIIPECHQG